MRFTLKNITLALVEGLDHLNARNIKSFLNEALVDKYSTTFDFYRRYGSVGLLFSSAVPSLSVAENRSQVHTGST